MKGFSHVGPKSSMKTDMEFCKRSKKMEVITHWNAASALHRPKGIITQMNVPQGVLNDVF